MVRTFQASPIVVDSLLGVFFGGVIVISNSGSRDEGEENLFSNAVSSRWFSVDDKDCLTLLINS